MRIGIITGASSGLGKEFLLQLDTSNLDQVWIFARRKRRLEELCKQVNCKVIPFCMDLCDEDDLHYFMDYLKVLEPEIAILIHAAGFGKMGDYTEVDGKESELMIQLNCIAAVKFTQICIPYMKKGSEILEICSTSSFQPFPELNVYAASKAFLYHYSLALREELRPLKINVIAICPYWIKDTEFIEIAQETNENAIKHYTLASNKKNVVKKALKDSKAHKAVSTPGLICSIHRILCKIIPYTWMIKMWTWLQKI